MAEANENKEALTQEAAGAEATVEEAEAVAETAAEEQVTAEITETATAEEIPVEEAAAAVSPADDTEADTKALAAWAQKTASKMTGGDPVKANKLKADKNMLYQVDCSVQLSSEKFYEVSMWNMFCRKRIYVVLMAIIYAIALLTIGGAIPRMKQGDTNGFILNLGFGCVFLILVIYMIYSQISRFKRFSKNEESLKKTAKHFRFTREMISNYRVEAQEERKYEWNQVEACYNRKDEIIICTKKDNQLLLVEKGKLNERELAFLTDIITENKLWKTSQPMSFTYVLFGAVTVLGVLYILQNILR